MARVMCGLHRFSQYVRATASACGHRRSLFLAGELAEAHRVSREGQRHAPSDERLGGIFDEKLAAITSPLTPAGPSEPMPSAAQARADLGGFDEVRIPMGGYCSEALTRDLPGGELAFGKSPDVWISRAPLLLPEDCARAIETAEAHARLRGGWTTSRHFEVPTTDLPMGTLPSLLPWFNRALADRILPAAIAAYPTAAPDASRLRVLDAFLVKYTAGAQAGLPVHCDQSLVSYTIALNDPSEYVGGGTWFRSLGRTLDAPSAGHALIFPGRLEHAGRPILRGQRYVIVLFLGYDANRSGRSVGWVLRKLRERDGAAQRSNKDEM